MKKITVEIVSEFLNSKEFELYPTQDKICIPIINRLYQKMMNDLKFDEIKVCENLIVDGHHRYVSSLLAKKAVGSVPSQTSSETKKHLWNRIELSEDDWDTEDKIKKFNQDDAVYNSISIEKIIEITK